MSTHSSGSLESLLRCPVQLRSTESSKLLVEVPQSTFTDAVCTLPGQSGLSIKLIFCYPLSNDSSPLELSTKLVKLRRRCVASSTDLATMTLKRTRGRSWTQMGKSSMPALPRHSLAHMLSQFLRLMLVTETWQWSGVSLSYLRFPYSGDLVWPQRFLPGHVLPDWSPLQGHLLQHALQECSVINPLI